VIASPRPYCGRDATAWTDTVGETYTTYTYTAQRYYTIAVPLPEPAPPRKSYPPAPWIITRPRAVILPPVRRRRILRLT